MRSTTGDQSLLVVDLARLGTRDLNRGGGKAANLGELLHAGFPVPPGFVITTDAYDLVVRSNELQRDIINASTPSGAALARAGFEQAIMPPQVEQAILDAYRRLGAGSVAVRSSATAEDLAEAAFAGQQETFLGVSGAAALLDAVRRCWASLWSDRAVSYREQHGLAQVPVKIAVIVQRMVAADVAGVMFTANPVTGARDETIVEASAGLGEALVSGLVTPDHIVLRNTRHRWQIVERQQGRREVEVRPRAGGGVEHVSGAAAQDPPCRTPFCCNWRAWGRRSPSTSVGPRISSGPGRAESCTFFSPGQSPPCRSRLPGVPGSNRLASPPITSRSAHILST